jgi:hypothetical protein
MCRLCGIYRDLPKLPNDGFQCDPAAFNGVEDGSGLSRLIDGQDFIPAAAGGEATLGSDSVLDASGAGQSALLTMQTGTFNSFSGDQNVDAILIGSRWTVMNQTFSFPTDGSYYVDYTTGENTTGFQAFNTAQQAAVRYGLSLVGSYCGVTFTEITETATTHATHRFAQTGLASVGSAYGNFPSDFYGAGDIWFGTTGQPFYTTPSIGNWGFATMLHEIGHTMGLKHGHSDYTNVDLSADLHVGSPRRGSRALTSNRNGQPYSLMTYQGGIGATQTFQGDGFNQPQSYMMYDIAALQYMYGANYGTNNSNTVYTFSTTTGEMSVNGVGQGAPSSNRVFRTVWDGGGSDTYDLSNYWTNLSINLEAGGWLVFDTGGTNFQRANNEPLSGTPNFAPGNVANALMFNGNIESLIENATGGTGDDALYGNRVGNTLTGNNGNDVLVGAGGNDTLNGGIGNDVLYGDFAPLMSTGVGLGIGVFTHGYGNITAGTAIDVTNTFTFASNADIENSTTTAHTTARFTTPTSGTLSASWYRVTLNAGTTLTLDIDRTTNSFDSWIRLIAADGTTQLASNDDGPSDTGSTGTLDSFLTYTTTLTGVYYLVVGQYSGGTTLPVNVSYDFNISVSSSSSLGQDGVAGNDTLNGGAGNDILDGGAGNDLLTDGNGTDIINGGGGFDRAIYAIASSAATITRNNDGTVTVSGSGFTDTVFNVELLAFTDRAISLRERNRTDMNGNGTSDIVLQSGTTLAAWNVSNGIATGASTLGVTSASDVLVGTGDFNGDGTTDLLLQNGGNFFSWNVSSGTVTSGTYMGTANGWTAVGTGDFNGDGTTDVLLRNGTQLLQWSVTNSRATSATTIGFLGAGWNTVGTGDFNGDGQTDVLLQNGTSIAVWNVINGQLVAGATMGTLSAGWSVAGTGDFNGDGTTDVLIRNGSTIADWIVRNNSAVSANYIGTADASWNIVGTGDYNSDGVADVALQNGATIVDWFVSGGVLLGSTTMGTAGGYTVRA